MLEATPGTLYRFAGVTIEGIAAAGEKATSPAQAFGVTQGTAVNADTIVGGQAALKSGLARQGLPFATVGEAEIVVDRETQTATLGVKVEPGAASGSVGSSPRAAAGCSMRATSRISPVSRRGHRTTLPRSAIFDVRPNPVACNDARRCRVSRTEPSTVPRVDPTPGRQSANVGVSRDY